MRLLYKFFVALTVVTVCACTSKEKKDTNNTLRTPTSLKDFERVFPPSMVVNQQACVEYVVTRFWDNFDFTDTLYCHAPHITEQAFVDFISLFPHADYRKVSEGIKKLLDSAEVNVVMYNYFLKLAGHYLYDPISQMRNDEYYIPFLEHVVASPKVVDSYKIQTQYFLNLTNQNRHGAKANDIVYTTASGSTGRLHNLSASYTILFFHNPDCKECHDTSDEMKASSVITAAVASGKVKVLAIFPDENLEVWHDHLKDFPSSWINGYDNGLHITTNDTYDLKAIPTLYLLDANKTVIMKDTSVGFIHNFLEANI